MGRAYDEGILQINHRSDAFMAMYANLKQTLRTSWELPDGYDLVFTSSATECWEIVIQSLLTGQVQFLYNGAFGKKWFKYAVHAPSQSFTLRGSRFLENESAESITLSSDLRWLCLVQNETSNGTAIPMTTLQRWREHMPETLIAVDATSSLGGCWLDWSLADVWFGSVQKCLGLPAGMAVMIVSPRAKEEALRVQDRRYYNSLAVMLENAAQNQTHTTPNVLSIYLLAELWKQLPPLRSITEHIAQRSAKLDAFFDEKGLHLIENSDVRSATVKALVGSPVQIERWKAAAQDIGITLGGGYGEWKGKTIRIANFPAIPDVAFQSLLTLF